MHVSGFLRGQLDTQKVVAAGRIKTTSTRKENAVSMHSTFIIRALLALTIRPFMRSLAVEYDFYRK
jgi:hypothetical protein